MFSFENYNNKRVTKSIYDGDDAHNRQKHVHSHSKVSFLHQKALLASLLVVVMFLYSAVSSHF